MPLGSRVINFIFHDFKELFLLVLLIILCNFHDSYLDVFTLQIYK